MGVLEDKRRARRFYRYLSVVYDRINPFVWTEPMREVGLDMLGIDPGDAVLDVGCGTGFGTAGLADRTDDVHGLDQSVHQLERAWEKLGKRGPIAFYVGDAEHLPFVDDAFDAVWSSGSIEYWPNPVATLAECRRVVSPGGRVLIVGPHAPRNRVLRRVAAAIMLFYDEAEADRMVRDAGLDVIEHRVLRAGPLRPAAIATAARVPE